MAHWLLCSLSRNTALPPSQSKCSRVDKPGGLGKPWQCLCPMLLLCQMLVTHTFHTLWCSKPMEPILGEKRMRHLIVWILLRQTPKPRKVSYNTQKEKSEKSSAYVNVPVKSLDPAVTVCQGQSGRQGSTEGQWWWEELRPGGPKKWSQGGEGGRKAGILRVNKNQELRLKQEHGSKSVGSGLGWVRTLLS